MVYDKNLSEEDKRKYAKEQFNFLRENGITNKLKLSRIFKAAGPGQIQESWKLATCCDWTTEDGEVKKDILDCLLAGMGGATKFGWDRMADVLDECEFYVPQAHSSNCFFRILRGAHEILVPGSCKFSKDEMEEIYNGLKKKGTDHISSNFDDDGEELMDPT